MPDLLQASEGPAQAGIFSTHIQHATWSREVYRMGLRYGSVVCYRAYAVHGSTCFSPRFPGIFAPEALVADYQPSLPANVTGMQSTCLQSTAVLFGLQAESQGEGGHMVTSRPRRLIQRERRARRRDAQSIV